MNKLNLPQSIAYYADQAEQTKTAEADPHQNLVVPDRRAIYRLKAVFAYYEKLIAHATLQLWYKQPS